MWLRQEVQALPRRTEGVTLTLTAPDSGIRTSTDGGNWGNASRSSQRASSQITRSRIFAEHSHFDGDKLMGAHADWAILTPIADEWIAMCSKLADAQSVSSVLPAKTGRIGSHSVVCLFAGKGEAKPTSAVHHAVQNWSVRWVILVGIAGGFPEKVKLGDVVVANFVYNFDYGKLKDGKFIRRPEYDYACDVSLLGYAEVVARQEGSPWTNRIAAHRPDGRAKAHSRCTLGYFASSDKVVDDPGHPFYKSIRDSVQEVHAVEMEGSGVGSAVRFLQSRGSLGLLMVRGISDEPREWNAAEKRSHDGAAQRDQWKTYAAHAAAAFVESLLLEIPPTPAVSETTAVSQWSERLPLKVTLEAQQLPIIVGHEDRGFAHVGQLFIQMRNISDEPVTIQRLEIETLKQWDLPNPTKSYSSRPIVQILDRSILSRAIKVSERPGVTAVLHFGLTLNRFAYKNLTVTILTDHTPTDEWWGPIVSGEFPFLLQPTLKGANNQYFQTERVLVSLNSHVAFSEWPRNATAAEWMALQQKATEVLDNLPEDAAYPDQLWDSLLKIKWLKLDRLQEGGA